MYDARDDLLKWFMTSKDVLVIQVTSYVIFEFNGHLFRHFWRWFLNDI